MSLLDKLETGFTRNHDSKPRGPFAARLQPLCDWARSRALDRDLKSTDCYSFSLCLRCAVKLVTPLILAYVIFWIIGTICIGISIWHSYPELFHIGRWQARVWHGLWRALWPGLVKKGFIMLPFVPLIWALFSLLLYLPRMFFWNRRAKRLQSTAEAFSPPQVAQAIHVTDIAQTDTSVWPPPPRHDDP